MVTIGDFAIGADHPALPGHFPGRPIVPGVILLDEALAIIATAFGLAAPLRLLRVKFTAPVGPGQRVTVLAEPPADGAMRFACASSQQTILSAVAAFDPPGAAP